MKDRLLLLITAIVAAALSWLFFYSLGHAAFSILLSIAVIGLLVNSKEPKFRKRKKNDSEK